MLMRSYGRPLPEYEFRSTLDETQYTPVLLVKPGIVVYGRSTRLRIVAPRVLRPDPQTIATRGFCRAAGIRSRINLSASVR